MTEQEALEQIHKMGVRLFGSEYDRGKSERRFGSWKRDNGIRAEDALKALVYWYDILGKPTDQAHGGFGIVPYIMEESHRYYEENERIHQTYTDEAIDKALNHRQRDVRISVPKAKTKGRLKGFELS